MMANLSRRALAGVAALLPLATAAAPPTSGPNAELLRLGAALEAAWAHQEALLPSCTDAELATTMAPCSALVDRIEQIPARTLEGLMVKARAISWCNSGEEIDPDRFCPYPGATTDGRIAASIVRDLLGRA